MPDTLKIEGQEVKAGPTMNVYLGVGKVIATVFDTKKNVVKKELKNYEGEGYKFIYFTVDNIHVVRIIDTTLR